MKVEFNGREPVRPLVPSYPRLGRSTVYPDRVYFQSQRDDHWVCIGTGHTVRSGNKCVIPFEIGERVTLIQEGEPQ